MGLVKEHLRYRQVLTFLEFGFQKSILIVVETCRSRILDQLNANISDIFSGIVCVDCIIDSRYER
jgi:hypothetical protein